MCMSVRTAATATASAAQVSEAVRYVVYANVQQREVLARRVGAHLAATLGGRWQLEVNTELIELRPATADPLQEALQFVTANNAVWHGSVFSSGGSSARVARAG